MSCNAVCFNFSISQETLDALYGYIPTQEGTKTAILNLGRKIHNVALLGASRGSALLQSAKALDPSMKLALAVGVVVIVCLLYKKFLAKKFEPVLSKSRRKIPFDAQAMHKRHVRSRMSTDAPLKYARKK